MTEHPETFIPLNRTEHGYAAIDGMACTMLQPYLLRLNEAVPVADMRRALRDLLSAHARMRAVLDPGLHFYRLRVLPDDELLDQLFDVAFHLDDHLDASDAQAMEALHMRMLNEPVPLERGLGLRFRYVPHPQQPVLFFAVHHMLLDGRSMVHAVGELLKRLNGKTLTPYPVESLSMIGAVAPRHWWQWPRQVARARQHKRAEAKQLAQVHIQQVPTRSPPHYAANALCHHVVSTGTPQIRQAARALGVSLNTFMIAAQAQAFLDLAPDQAQSAAVIRLSVDLRKYYPDQAGRGPLLGNHVGAFLVVEQEAARSLKERVRSVGEQIKTWQARYEQREMCWTYLWDELLPGAGRTLIGHIARQLQRKDKFPRISCHATSLGDGSHLNAPGARIRLVSILPGVTSISLLTVLVEFEGRLYLPVSWQLAHTTREEIGAFLAQLDATVERLVQQALQPAAGGLPESEAAQLHV